MFKSIQRLKNNKTKYCNHISNINFRTHVRNSRLRNFCTLEDSTEEEEFMKRKASATQHHNHDRQQSQEEEMHKRVKFHHVPSSDSLQQLEKETETHNLWRVDSVNNPVWNVRLSENNTSNEKFSSREQLIPNRFTFHSSLLQVQKDVNDIYSLHITEREQKIFDFLLTVNETYKMGTTLRVAGGWVRNKLLHMSGEDIDIALDNCMGVEFAQNVLDYEKKHDLPDQYHSIGVISANPDQSKHLETATTHINGEPIDFVNLRCEEYAEDSDHRIPTAIRVGTPEEDAFRRDLTINSLFYNINEAKVEDFTKRGVDDLRFGVIRTPLPPLKTFLDDPLRVLRAVRFAAAFNFIVADELIEAAKNSQVAKALADKVSRERVGIEMKKILYGKDPVGAFALLRECNVHDIVFTLSSHTPRSSKQTRVYENPISLQWTDQQWYNALFKMRVVFKYAHDECISDEQRAALLMAAAISNIVPTDCLPDQNGTDYQVPDTLITWCDNLLCTSLKFPMKFRTDVATILYGAHHFNSCLLNTENDATKLHQLYSDLIHSERLKFGKILRAVKELYPLSAVLSSVYDTHGIEFDELPKITTSDGSYQGQYLYQAIESLYDGKFKEVINMKCLLDGKEVAAVLGVNPGEIITPVHKDLLEWQIVNFSDIISVAQDMKQKATEWLQSQRERYLELEKELIRKRTSGRRGKK